MSVWRKRFDKGDIALRKTDNKKLTDKTDFEAWDILFTDFVDKVGLDETFKGYLDNIQQLIAEQAKFILSEKIDRYGTTLRDRFILNKIKYLEALIQDFEKQGNTDKVTIPKMLNKLSKMQGVYLKEEEVMVDRYFEMIKDYKEWVKER
jgi:hypothetical protein